MKYSRFVSLNRFTVLITVLLSSLLAISSQASVTLQELYSFPVPAKNPYAALIQAKDGNFYSTTFSGVEVVQGTIFQLTPAGELTTLLRFEYSTTGASPFAGLVQGTDGNFYGTTSAGGGDYTQQGTVFQITPEGAFTNLVS